MPTVFTPKTGIHFTVFCIPYPKIFCSTSTLNSIWPLCKFWCCTNSVISYCILAFIFGCVLEPDWNISFMSFMKIKYISLWQQVLNVFFVDRNLVKINSMLLAFMFHSCKNDISLWLFGFIPFCIKRKIVGKFIGWFTSFLFLFSHVTSVISYSDSMFHFCHFSHWNFDV